MRAKEQVSTLIDSLITEGEDVLKTEWVKSGNWPTGAPRFVDLSKFRKWQASCHLLVHLLGNQADPWRKTLEENSANSLTVAVSMQGILRAIREAVDNNLLIQYEDLVFAEAFSDLIEQAEYLLSQGYALAAGVIFRAVLEEHLRRMTDSKECRPDKSKPTIADYNMALYKAKVYDKISLKHVESMSAIGNAAAHNSAEFLASDVARLNQELISFLRKFSM